MKITAIETVLVDAFRANFLFVRVTGEDGLVGVGEGTVEHREPTVACAIDELARTLIGQDAFRIEQMAELASRDSYWRTGVVLRSALAAVEVALFDLKAKALGVSVADLLGGRQRERIRAYANGWFVGASTPDEFAAKAQAAVALGFQGLKWDPFGKSWLDLDGAARRRAIETVEAVRGAVGPDVELMIEGHGRFSVPTALAIARDLAPFRPYWFEEPIPPESIDALVDLRRASPIPIATGERYYEPARFAELIHRHAADYLQPDVCHVGGLAAAKLIAGMAHLQWLPLAPHNPMGPIGNAATLQLAAATPNVSWLETMMTDVPWRAELVRETAILEDGMMHIPSGPGLGIELDWEACQRFTPKVYELRHYRGTLTQIRPAEAKPFFTIIRDGHQHVP
ncbi:MAG: mandelate racemase/muconate lactonizing enzyme family protein [Alphaproteobacteria bacterium]|nr:mandelate racemase/muconate lactonizing enzyme family protein [Alphaproteobacteria bacterium]TAD89837.1 MAG: mandelate racemase/muconate lactonizing enzyme family protein [Alphaproteobacteria bacterium]